jgi:hypothetical protein
VHKAAYIGIIVFFPEIVKAKTGGKRVLTQGGRADRIGGLVGQNYGESSSAG